MNGTDVHAIKFPMIEAVSADADYGDCLDGCARVVLVVTVWGLRRTDTASLGPPTMLTVS